VGFLIVFLKCCCDCLLQKMKVESSTKVAFVPMPSSLAQNLASPAVSSAVRMCAIAIRLKTTADFESVIR